MPVNCAKSRFAGVQIAADKARRFVIARSI
jgi:hypothetical protein